MRFGLSEAAWCGRFACRTSDIIIVLHSSAFDWTSCVAPVTVMATATSRPFEYLQSLPGVTLRKLYQQPSTALAIFRRMLPDLGIFSSPQLLQ